jgi:branched-chain amino acid transport system permease protein
MVLGIFLLGIILFLPRGIGSLWIRRLHRGKDFPTTEPVVAKGIAQ